MSAPAYKREVPVRTVVDNARAKGNIALAGAALVAVTTIVGLLYGLGVVLVELRDNAAAEIAREYVSACGEPEDMLKPECFFAYLSKYDVTTVAPVQRDLEIHDGTAQTVLATFGANHTMTVNGRVVIHGVYRDIILDPDHPGGTLKKLRAANKKGCKNQ